MNKETREQQIANIEKRIKIDLDNLLEGKKEGVTYDAVEDSLRSLLEDEVDIRDYYDIEYIAEPEQDGDKRGRLRRGTLILTEKPRVTIEFTINED